MERRKIMEENKKICMIVDASVLQEMIEDNNSQKAVEVLNMLKQIDETKKDKNSWIITTQASLLRAIYLADKNKFNLQNLQKIIGCMTITPSFADFRNIDSVTKEIIMFAKTISEKGKKQNGNKI
jgi:hypothetical protein